MQAKHIHKHTQRDCVQRVCVCVCAHRCGSPGKLSHSHGFTCFCLGGLYIQTWSVCCLCCSKKKRKCVSTRRLHIRDDFRSNAPRTIHSVFLLHFFFFRLPGFRFSRQTGGDNVEKIEEKGSCCRHAKYFSQTESSAGIILKIKLKKKRKFGRKEKGRNRVASATLPTRADGVWTPLPF